MRDYGIDKGLIEFRDDSARNQRGWMKGFFGFRKMFRDYLTKLNVPFYDPCCPALTGDSLPVRWNDDTEQLERFDGEEWIPVDVSGSIPDPLEVNALTVGTVSAQSGSVVFTDPIATNEGISHSLGNEQFVGFYLSASAQTDIPAGTGGAIPLTSYFTTISTDAGGDAFTLGSGTIPGQMKKILLLADGGGNATITGTFLGPATTITMNDANDYVVLIWRGSMWTVIENMGATVS